MTAISDVLTNLCLSIYDKFVGDSTTDEIEGLMVIGDQPVGGAGPAIEEGAFVYNDFFESINGQLFEDIVPESAVYPYAVYNIPSASGFDTFSEEYTDASISLAIYSDDMDTSEIKLIYRYASDLFDECILVVTGSTLVSMKEQNLTTMLDNHITMDGTKTVLVYTIDFEVITSLK